MLQVLADLQQLVQQGQADLLLAVRLLAQLLVGALGVGGEAVEAGLQLVAHLGQGLLEDPCAGGCSSRAGDDLLAQLVDGRGAERLVVAAAAGGSAPAAPAGSRRSWSVVL